MKTGKFYLYKEGGDFKLSPTLEADVGTNVNFDNTSEEHLIALLGIPKDKLDELYKEATTKKETKKVSNKKS